MWKKIDICKYYHKKIIFFSNIYWKFIKNFRNLTNLFPPPLFILSPFHPSGQFTLVSSKMHLLLTLEGVCQLFSVTSQMKCQWECRPSTRWEKVAGLPPWRHRPPSGCRADRPRPGRPPGPPRRPGCQTGWRACQAGLQGSVTNVKILKLIFCI